METDVSTAQSFDVASFLGNLVNTGAAAYVATKTAPSQATGKPAATTTPNLIAAPGQNTAVASGLGMSNQTMMLLGLGAAAILAVALLRKS